MMPYGVLFCMSVHLSTPPGWPLDPSSWPLDPSSRPSDPTSLKRQLEGSEGLLEGSKGQQEGSEGQLVGSEGQLDGSEGHLSGFEGQPGGNGWMAKLTYGQTEVLPILQDFVPYQGRCHSSPHENQESRAGQGNHWPFDAFGPLII